MRSATARRGAGTDASLRTYEDRWGATGRIVQLRPHLWRELAPRLSGRRVLEIGPGLRPTAPVRGSFFVETSPRATEVLAGAGGRAVRVRDGALPFRDGAFEAVLALEVLEHVEEDERLLGDIGRVLRPDGLAVLSVPLYMTRWTASDEACAHVRRYEPAELFTKLRAAGFVAERYAVRPARSHPALASMGSGVLQRMPRLANWWLQNVVFSFQSAWQRGMTRIRWRPVSAPVSRRAAGITVVARSAGPGRPAS